MDLSNGKNVSVEGEEQEQTVGGGGNTSITDCNLCGIIVLYVVYCMRSFCKRKVVVRSYTTFPTNWLKTKTFSKSNVFAPQL